MCRECAVAALNAQIRKDNAEDIMAIALKAIAITAGVLAESASRRDDTHDVREFSELQRMASEAVQKAGVR